MQIRKLCEFFLRKVWNVTAIEINRFFADEALTVYGCDLFDALFDEKLQEVAPTGDRDYEFLIKIRNQLIIESSYRARLNRALSRHTHTTRSLRSI